MKTTRKRTGQSHLFRARHRAKGSVSAPWLPQAEGGAAVQPAKGKASGGLSLGAVGWGSWRELSRSGASYAIGEGCILEFTWLVLTSKWGQKLGQLSVIDQAQVLWGQLFQKLLFSFPGCFRDSNLASWAVY